MNCTEQFDGTLSRPSDGEGGAPRRSAAEILAEMYEELRRLARSRLSRLKPGQTLQPTALVHEAYLRIAAGQREASEVEAAWDNRGHFFAAAAQAMWEVIIDHARQKASAKRGGGRARYDLSEVVLAIDLPEDDLLALDDALRKLQREDERKHQLVMLRFFAGFTAEQAAEALQVSLRTVERDWRYARAWLRAELGAGGEEARHGD